MLVSGISVLGVTLDEYGAPALLAVAVLLVLLGYLVPRKDRDEWRKAAVKSAEQVDLLIEALKPMSEFYRRALEREQTRETPKQGGDPS